MGKNNNKSDFQSMEDLQNEMKKLQKKMAKQSIGCSHTNDNGKLKVDFLHGTSCKCKKCKIEFDFEQIEEEEIKEAAKVIHNAINQIKALSDDPVKEKSVIIELGTIDYNLKELVELYIKTINQKTKGGKKNKKKNKGNNNQNVFGNYGTSNIKFI